jgi:hypothetical protein
MWRTVKENTVVSNQELLARVGAKLAIVNAQISTKEQEEIQRIQLQSQAMAMSP